MGRPRHVSDETILKIARDCFREGGPAVSTEAIAERANISQAALFKRFHSKDELMFAALFPPQEPSWLALLESGPDARPIRAQLREIGRAFDRYFEEYVPNFAVLRACGALAHPPSRRSIPPAMLAHRALTLWFRRAAARGLVSGRRTQTLAMMFLGAFQSRAMAQHFTGGALALPRADAYVASVVDALCDGIEPAAAKGGRR
ncbi:TetR/AcrR family transcriptional regulator [bacterium]|nr:TetR/AcrR family transcriptional regulator [bacterium]